MAAPTKGRLPDLERLKQDARLRLTEILQKARGTKDVFIDAVLMKPLDRLAGVSLLKQNGVDKIFKLDSSMSASSQKHEVFIIRPEVSNVKLITERVKAVKSANGQKPFTIVMVPRNLYLCGKVLEQEGVYEYVTVEVLPFEILPLDTDILSMELESFYTSVMLHRDETWLHTVASALVSIQQHFGKFPNVYAVGPASKSIWALSETLAKCREVDWSGLKSEIGQIILLDRDCDLVTPLCSQVTYEGLLDDIFSIQCGAVEFGPDVTGSDKTMKILVNSNDEIYEEIRNRHFSVVSRFLSERAKQLQTGYDKGQGIKSVQDMKNFVANDLKSLKEQHKSLSLHIRACEVIMEKKTVGGNLEEQLAAEHGLLEGSNMTENVRYIENSIYQQSDKVTTLRLMCLFSLVKDGLPIEQFQALKTAFLQSHGYHHLVTFHHLERLGLYTKKAVPQQNTIKLPGAGGPAIKITPGLLSFPIKSSFQLLCKNLQLIPKNGEDFDLRHPTDMAYVFSGAFTPLSCKLIDMVLQRQGFSGIEETLKLVTNLSNVLEITKPLSAKGGKTGQTASSDPTSRTVLVCFIGGVTYSEIAALRFLGHLRGFSFLILATNIVNGSTFIRRLMEV